MSLTWIDSIDLSFNPSDCGYIKRVYSDGLTAWVQINKPDFRTTWRNS